MRICIDMDEVIADNYPKFLDRYEQQYGHRLSYEEYVGGKIYDLAGANELRQVLHEPGWFADLPVIEDAIEVVRELYEQHEVFILSSATEFRHSMFDKINWLEQHFPFIHHRRITFCGDKGIAHGDYLIDDKVKNLNNFLGEGLLFTAPDNVYEKTAYPRFDNWQQIREFFKGMK